MVRARARGAAASHRGSGYRRPCARRALPGAAWLPGCDLCPLPAEPGSTRLQSSPGPAPAAGSERTPSRPPPTAGLFPSAEGHCARLAAAPPPSHSSLPPRGGGGGGICRLIYHQSFAQAGIFKAVPATFPAPEHRSGAGWGGGSHPKDPVPSKHRTKGFRSRNTIHRDKKGNQSTCRQTQRTEGLLNFASRTMPGGRGEGQVGMEVTVR